MRASVGYIKGAIPVEAMALIGGLFALLLINLQLWGIDAAPLIDWPNHLARHILQCGGPGADLIGRYYEYDLEIVPNLTSDLIHTLDVACRNPEITQKVLIQASSIGVVLSTVVLNRAIWGTFSVWPVISGLIMHHMSWAYGFENFTLTIPITLLVLAFWFAFANQSTVIRLMLLWPLAVGLYVLHIYAFAFLLLVVGCLEIERLWTAGVSKSTWRSTITTFALLVLIAAFPAFHTITSINSSPEIQATQWQHGGLSTLIKTLISPFSGFSDPTQSNQAMFSGVAALLAFALICSGLSRYSKGMTIDPRVRHILPVLLLATLVAPNNFFGVFFSNIRIPVLVLALLIAATRVAMPTRVVWAFTSAVMIAVALKTGWIASKWRIHDEQVAELRQAADFLKPTDHLLVLREARNEPVILHSHSASYLVRDRGSYWMGLFTGGNSLSPRPEYAQRDHTQPFPFYWRYLDSDYQDLPLFNEGGLLYQWPTFYTHALLLFDPETDRPDASALGDVLSSGSFFTIYQISPATAEDGTISKF